MNRRERRALPSQKTIAGQGLIRTGFSEEGQAGALAEAGSDGQQLLAELAKGVVAEANQLESGRRRRGGWGYASWLFALAVLGLVVTLIWETFQRAEWHVVAAHDLPALMPIDPRDLTLAPGRAGAGEFQILGEVVARYPLAKVKRGTVLQETSLSQGSWRLPGQDSSLMTVPLKSGWDFGGWKMPVKATLIESSRQGGGVASAVSLPVLVVVVKAKGATTSVVVSTAETDREKRAAFLAGLGSSEVYVAVTAP